MSVKIQTTNYWATCARCMVICCQFYELNLNLFWAPSGISPADICKPWFKAYRILHVDHCNEFLKRHSMLCLTGSVLWCWWDLTNHWSALLCPCVQVLANSSNALALAAFSSAAEIQSCTKWNAMQLCPRNHWRVAIWGFLIFSLYNFTLGIFYFGGKGASQSTYSLLFAFFFFFSPHRSKISWYSCRGYRWDVRWGKQSN